MTIDTNNISDSTFASIGQPLSEHELCPDDLISGQEAAFNRDIERLHRRRKEFVAVSCPCCGEERPTFAFEKHGFSFVRCPECLTVYMSPRPSEQVMADYYSNSENYAYWAKFIFPASEAVRREKIHKLWLSRVLDFAKRYGVANGRLVEVGPGFGTFCSVAIEAKAFEEVIAVEPTPELAQACRERGVQVVQKRIEDAAADLLPADVMVAFEVIEHLFDPALFLAHARQLIRPNGLLVLSCPNCLGFDIAELGSKSLAVDAEHVNLFNPGSLSRLVESVGFETLEITTPGRLDAELVRDAVLAGKHSLNSPFLRRVLLDDWDTMGWVFQQFLAENQLSGHMWLVARNTGVEK